MKTKLFISIVSILFLIYILFMLTSCKPSMPEIKDYKNMPCYIADVCVRVNAYMENNKNECNIAFQKCFRYSDFDKCYDVKTLKEHEQCLEDLSVNVKY